MLLEDLYSIIDIETGEDFQYFENFAELSECDAFIDNEILFELFSEIDMHTFAELAESYFYDVVSNIPDSQIDLYNLFENIKRVIIGLSQSFGSDKTAAVRMAEEFNRFRNWYSAESSVQCRNLNTEEISYLPVRDALVLSRLEKLNGDEYKYDFSDALEYELDEYIMTFSDMVSED